MPKFLVEWLKSLDSREQTELVKWLYDTWPDDIQSSLIDILNGCAED